MRTYPQIKESLILENGVRYNKKFAINGKAGIVFPALDKALANRTENVYTFSVPDDVELYGITLVRVIAMSTTLETNEFIYNQSYHISAENTRLGKWLDDFHFGSNVSSIDGGNNGFLPGASPFAPGNELFNPYLSPGPSFYPGAAHPPKFDISPTAQSQWTNGRIIEENCPFVQGKQGIILSEKEVLKVTFSTIKWSNSVAVGVSPTAAYYAYFYGRVLK